MRVDGYDPVHCPGQQPPDHLLADRFAVVESSILTHVAHVRRDEDRPAARAIAPQRLAANMIDELFFGRAVERGIDDARRGRGADRYTPVPRQGTDAMRLREWECPVATRSVLRC